MDQRTCNHCGTAFSPTHGLQRYCERHRGAKAQRERELVDRECVQCGSEWRTRRANAKLCSDTCRSAYYVAQRIRPAKPPIAPLSFLPTSHPVRVLIRAQAWPKSPLRAALEARDHTAVIEAIRRDCEVNDNGCWIWQRKVRDGYATVNVGDKAHAVHRLALEAKHGAPLGKQAAHHMCAVTACVNPAHLQPVTARENTAEMLARTYMESRIADLEAALTELAPWHPLLSEIGLSAS